MYDLNLIVPNITSEKYSQENKFLLLKNYLYELNEVLSYALADKSYGEISEIKKSVEKISDEQGVSVKQLRAQSVKKFNELKEQILTAADEIEREYTSFVESAKNQIMQSVKGDYVAKSDFGEYRDTVETQLRQQADSIELTAESTEQIKGRLVSVTDTQEILQNAQKSLEDNQKTLSDTQKSLDDNQNSLENAQKILRDDITTLGDNQNALAKELEEDSLALDEYKKTARSELSVQSDAIMSQVEDVYTSKNETEQLESRVYSKISQTATDVTETFNQRFSQEGESIGEVESALSGFISDMEVYIRRGELANGVYGIEIGRTDSNIKARFTNDRLSFYRGVTEVAYISGNSLYITDAHILDYLKIGDKDEGYFMFDCTENGLEVRWING